MTGPNKRWKPTARECLAIKEAGSRESGLPRSVVLLEPGIWSNENKAASHMNKRLVSDEPDFGNASLFNYGAWSDFRKGVSLADDGSAVVDFYIRRRFDGQQALYGNITVSVKEGKMTRITGYGMQGAEYALPYEGFD